MKTKKLQKNIVLLMSVIIVSKLFGMLRDVFLANYYGTSNISDAYLIASSVPVLLFYFIGHALSTAYIPIYLYHKMSLKATHNLFAKTDALITNSDELGQEFMEKYSIKKLKTVMMASNIDYRFNPKVRSIKDTRVAYLGALGKYRIDALISIAEALGKINPELKLDIYGRTLDKNILNKLKGCKHIEYKGFVSYETVIEVMQNVSLLIEAINIDKKIERNKKYGFSTKYADSFACGTPFFVYCPKGIIEARFAIEHKCAFVATNEMELEELLKVALFDEEKRQKQIETARNITNRYFNNENNIATVNELISECINERNNLI